MKNKTSFSFIALFLISVLFCVFSSAAPAIFGTAVTPATGDNSHTVIWLVVFIISLVALVFTLYSMNKHKPVK